MDNNQIPSHPTIGMIYVGVCGICGIFTWINFHNLDAGFTFFTKIVSVTAGIMAVRHYFKQYPIKNPFKTK